MNIFNVVFTAVFICNAVEFQSGKALQWQTTLYKQSVFYEHAVHIISLSYGSRYQHTIIISPIFGVTSAFWQTNHDWDYSIESENSYEADSWSEIFIIAQMKLNVLSNHVPQCTYRSNIQSPCLLVHRLQGMRSSEGLAYLCSHGHSD